MKTNYVTLLCFTFLAVGFYGCQSDDDTEDPYVPVNFQLTADAFELFQDEPIQFNLFDNDSNIPEGATVVFENLGGASVSVSDPNNTPQNLQDDIITYTASNTYSETASFLYTVCDMEGLSCETAQVNVKIYKPFNIQIAQLPYPILSDYNFFYSDMANQEPAPGVLPYKPISQLFSDYAKKKRFVWMPKGVSAQYISDESLLNFPNGTIIIKSFYYDNVLPSNTTKIIETRLLIKKDGQWSFADYIWDEEQQEAFLDTTGDGANVEIQWVQDGEQRFVNYRIPSTSQCITCHKSFKSNTPIGPKPQNLNGTYAFDDGDQNQLQKWIETGYLQDNLPGNIETVVDWEDQSKDLTLRVRSYFDINCASCHIDGGHCDYRDLRLAYSESASDDNLGICLDPQTPIPGFEDKKLIEPGDPANSILYFRLETTLEEYRMPLLGRTLVHDESLALIEEWINSLNNVCD